MDLYGVPIEGGGWSRGENKLARDRLTRPVHRAPAGSSKYRDTLKGVPQNKMSFKEAKKKALKEAKKSRERWRWLEEFYRRQQPTPDELEKHIKMQSGKLRIA